MAEFLKNIKFAPPSEPVTMVWGGGHTLVTDPTRNGWRCRYVRGVKRDMWMIGRPGHVGCASIICVGDTLDVAVYLETPQTALGFLKRGDTLDARYEQFPAVSGVGLKIIKSIKEELAQLAELAKQ